MTDTCDFLQLATSGVRGLKPYLPGKPIEELERELGIDNIIKLASNENPLGPSPKALAAIADAGPQLALYPDGSGFRLKQALARRHGVDENTITLGNGSNDVLVLLAEAFLSPEHSSVFSQYCFAVYPIATQAVGAKGIQVAANPVGHPMPLGHDLDAMLAAIRPDTRLVFLANPNNPTGTWLEPEALASFIGAVPKDCLVVLDQAYVEYEAPEDQVNATDWIARHPNLVVTRTFSKAFGLAGLRVGYAVSHPQVAGLLNRIRQPFNVNSLALLAAEAALGDSDFLERSRLLNQGGLSQLGQGLEELGLEVIPSAGNFLLADMGENAAPVYEFLLREGVIVRPVANYGLERHLRISIGTEAQNQQCLAALARYRERQE